MRASVVLDNSSNNLLSGAISIKWEELQFPALPVVLGKGAYASVIEAQYHGVKCAVKQLHGEVMDDVFQREINILSILRHPHIVSFLGYSTKPPDGTPCLVLECLEGGTFESALFGHPKLSASAKVKLLWQVSTALLFLHARSPAIVHRDVSPSNILLDKSKETAKLSDFGISRSVKTMTTQSVAATGSPAYLAPECFTPQEFAQGIPKDTKLLSSVDVYAFAMVVWASFAEERPFQEFRDNAMALMFQASSGNRPALAKMRGAPLPLQTLVESAWKQDAGQRPTMKLFVDVLASCMAVGNDGEASLDECIVCMERAKTHILVPCGHYCVCGICAAILRGKGCPLCRTVIQSTHQVFH